MNKKPTFYAKCPQCSDYYQEAKSVADARAKLEEHEKEKHKGKQVGIFGVAWDKKS